MPAAGGIYPGALALAAVFGVLVTLAFAVLPLGRARAVPATALFREMGMGGHGLPHWTYVAFALGIAALLAALAVWFAADRRIAAIFVGAAIFAFIVLRARRSRNTGAGAQGAARALDGAAAGASATSIGRAR